MFIVNDCFLLIDLKKRKINQKTLKEMPDLITQEELQAAKRVVIQAQIKIFASNIG